MLALKEAVRRETGVELIMEESPVGDHQANGLAENAVKNTRANSDAEGLIGDKAQREADGGAPSGAVASD